ncbi:MAG TPA: ATP-binding protein [Chthoniobacteraceae bacterium]|jgi:signal transduction histidine kinase|nr:ATP-binding protein [Chthoniobacteraceae bacterium]
MSITQRILLHVGLGTALVVAVVTAVTYRLVYEALQARDLKQLEIYVQERTRREENGFRTIYSNLEVVRGQFLKRDREPAPPDLQERWNQRFMLYPDGAWRSREEFFSPRVYSNLWLRKDVPLTPQIMTRILRAQEICEDVEPGWVDSFISLYFILPGPATMGFDPRIARWSWQTPGDYDLEAEEWMKESTPERNPSRGFTWTGVFVDPPSGKPFVTVQLPVEKDGVQIATVAHDMHINQLFEEMARSDFEGATHMIFRPDGRLIVHQGLREKILASNGALTAESSGDPALANLYRLAVAQHKPQFSGFEPVSASYFSASRLPGAEWYFVTMMPQATVQRQASASARWVLWSGLVSLALVLGSIACVLRRQIARPLRALTGAARAMSAGAPRQPLPALHRDELGELAASFGEMMEKVAARENDLRQLNQDLEQRVAARTEALHDALEREKELSQIKSSFVSMVSHEFRTPLGVIMSATDVLSRYFERLAPEKRARHLEMISRSTRNLAALIEEVLLLGRVEEGRMKFAPVPVDLEKFCRSLTDELYSATGGACPIRLHIANPLEGAIGDESLLRHILSNLLSNAVKYSTAGEPVEFAGRRAGGEVVFTIRDRGIGIPEEDRPQLFTSFMRGRNVGTRPGTGLGLVVVQRCVQLHGGELSIESKLGEGTTATVVLPVFPPAVP